MKTPKLIAFFLPQFHPIPENDRWWGKGFTEWTNVTKATPLFEGHLQPHLPRDLGFYDLRVDETRREQIKMAKKFGIDGFCYHYYWFSGKRLLNIPLDKMLNDKQSNMPFCLCWANENWTRKWDASEHDVLIEQKYLKGDALEFIKSLVPFLKDKRYIKVKNKPFIIVYRPQSIPDIKKTLNIWRNYCKKIGLGQVHISAALTHGNQDYIKYGFDSGVEFPPHNLNIGTITHKISFFNTFFGNVFSYSDIADNYLNRKYNDPLVFKTIFPSWDNTARTNNRALITVDAEPMNYELWLARTIKAVKNAKNNKLVFINAWNEWAEGCHLEPDNFYGCDWLKATLNAKKGLTNVRNFKRCHKSSVSSSHKLNIKNQIIFLLKVFVKKIPPLHRLSLRIFTLINK